MTVTIDLGMIFPALLVIAALVLLALSTRESGMFGGCAEAAAALALLAIAGAFLIGRWLA